MTPPIVISPRTFKWWLFWKLRKMVGTRWALRAMWDGAVLELVDDEGRSV